MAGPRVMREALVRLVNHISQDAALREDMLQEALLHLWLMETRRPGQTQSWYLQSCRFHLQHYLTAGRSIDSGKRRGKQLQVTEEAGDDTAFPESMDSGNSVYTLVSAREIIALLSRTLNSQEKEVLEALAEGLGPREIGRELNMSHTMVIKHRRRIAALLTRLELPRQGTLSPVQANGSRHNGNHKRPNGQPSAVAAHKAGPELTVERSSSSCARREAA